MFSFKFFSFIKWQPLNIISYYIKNFFFFLNMLMFIKVFFLTNSLKDINN